MSESCALMKFFVAGIDGANVEIHRRSNAPLFVRDSNPGVLHIPLDRLCRTVCDNLCGLDDRIPFLGAVGDNLCSCLIAASCAGGSLL